MKKQISLFVAMLLFSAATVFANQMPNVGNRLIVSIEKSADAATSLDLRLANLEKQGTFVELRDLQGNTWFSQFVWRKHGYAKKLNLKGMPDGNYLLSVQHKEATIVQMLRLSNGVLTVEKHQRMEVPTQPGKDLAKGK